MWELHVTYATHTGLYCVSVPSGGNRDDRGVSLAASPPSLVPRLLGPDGSHCVLVSAAGKGAAKGQSCLIVFVAMMVVNSGNGIDNTNYASSINVAQVLLVCHSHHPIVNVQTLLQHQW